MGPRFKFVALPAIAFAMLTAGCGEFVDSGRSPSRVFISTLEGASGATPAQFGGTLNSDVITNVQRQVNNQSTTIATIFDDIGRVTMGLTLRDQGNPGAATAPSALNQVTFTRYRVVYRRADGRNTPGVDVPFPFDSGLTFTVPVTGNITVGFELVRHVSKEESPLRELVTNAAIISTIADVTFYGQDQAGNAVTVTGTIGIQFGNFGDPS